ncbi:MAG TPA: Ig-like domain-containing protein, partial [Catalimonadaceae bacterium]|nr:Ig-like domain-containing protein [Catalimonadaceae bacterium]
VSLESVIYAFLDDFQAPVWQANYQVTLDSIRIPLYESVVNALIQTGPIGKIVKLPIPQNLLYLLADGQLKIRFDDYTTGAGDGFAIDFVKLVINPVNTSGTCVLKGKVTDFFFSGAPIPNVKVMANGLDSAMTDALGNYRISGVDPGIILIQTYKAGYGAEVASLVLAENDSVSKDFQLKTGAPQLTYNSPAQGATQVSLQSKIKMVFSQTINASTFNTFSFTLTDGQNPVSGQCQSNGDTLLFIPEALEMGKTYTATVTTSLKSMAGVPLDRNYSFQFQTLTPLKVNPEMQQEGLKVFPNPGAGNLVVSGVKEQDLLEIIGMDGRVYFSEKGNASPIEIPVSVLKPGLYMVKRKGLKEQETIRFIRN